MIVRNLPTAAIPVEKSAMPDDLKADFSDRLKEKVAAVTDGSSINQSAKKRADDSKTPVTDGSKAGALVLPDAPFFSAVATLPATVIPATENADGGEKGNVALASLASLQPWGVQLPPPAKEAITQQTEDGQGSNSAPALETFALRLQSEGTDNLAEEKTLPGTTGRNPFEGLSAQKISEAAGEAIVVNKSPLFPVEQHKMTGTAAQSVSVAAVNHAVAASVIEDVPASLSKKMPDESLTLLAKQHDAIQVMQTPPTRTATLNQQLGTPAWQQSLGQQLTMFTRNGVQNAELRLHPEELGALQINLRLNNDQAQLHFVTGNHQVRAALEAAMPHLRISLEESGINLGQASVGADASSWHAPHSEQAFTEKNYQQNRGDVIHNEEEKGEVITKEVNLLQGINTFV